MSAPKFADGMRIRRPANHAPQNVIANASINKEDFIKFLQAQEGDTVYINIMASKTSDNWYACLSEWKPDPTRAIQSKPRGTRTNKPAPAVQEPDYSDYSVPLDDDQPPF